MPESFGEKGRPLFLWDLFLGKILNEEAQR